MWEPMSCTSGHCFNIKRVDKTMNSVVKILTLKIKEKINEELHSSSIQQSAKNINPKRQKPIQSDIE